MLPYIAYMDPMGIVKYCKAMAMVNYKKNRCKSLLAAKSNCARQSSAPFDPKRA